MAEKVLTKKFPIKVYFDTKAKKPVGPSFPEQLKVSIPVLSILQACSILMADRGNKLPPLQMPDDVVEANAELIVHYTMPPKKKKMEAPE